MLNIEECKNLEKWGMPQELEFGDWYYYEHSKVGPLAYLYQKGHVHPKDVDSMGNEYYRIPDLETIMEFARILNDDWLLIARKEEPFWTLELWFRTVTSPGKKDWVYQHNSPVKAVYNLIAKIQEESQCTLTKK